VKAGRFPKARVSKSSQSIGKGRVAEDMPLWRKVTTGEKQSWLEKGISKVGTLEFIESSVSKGKVSVDPSFQDNHFKKSGVAWMENSQRMKQCQSPS
jgi:hypothetical protein